MRPGGDQADQWAPAADSRNCLRRGVPLCFGRGAFHRIRFGRAYRSPCGRRRRAGGGETICRPDSTGRPPITQKNSSAPPVRDQPPKGFRSRSLSNGASGPPPRPIPARVHPDAGRAVAITPRPSADGICRTSTAPQIRTHEAASPRSGASRRTACAAAWIAASIRSTVAQAGVGTVLPPGVDTQTGGPYGRKRYPL